MGIGRPEMKVRRTVKKQASKLHYFGASEEEYFSRAADQRTRLLRPLAMFFVYRHVRSDMLSLFSFLLLPFFFFPLIGLGYYKLAWVILFVHICLDGLDGPVARLGRYASDRGALSDIMNDITAMVVVALPAMYYGWADQLLGGMYMVTYVYMIIFIIARNVMEKPFKFVFKSKYYLFLFFLIRVHFKVDILNPFLLIMSVYQTVVTIVGFFYLRRNLPGVLGAGTRGAWPGPDKVASRQARQKKIEKLRKKLRRRFPLTSGEDP